MHCRSSLSSHSLSLWSSHQHCLESAQLDVFPVEYSPFWHSECITKPTNLNHEMTCSGTICLWQHLIICWQQWHICLKAPELSDVRSILRNKPITVPHWLTNTSNQKHDSGNNIFKKPLKGSLRDTSWEYKRKRKKRWKVKWVDSA